MSQQPKPQIVIRVEDGRATLAIKGDLIIRSDMIITAPTREGGDAPAA